MPVAALVCRLTAWFVLGAGAAGALFFVGYDGLGVPVAAFLLVLSAVLAVMLWALGRVCAETARIARRLAPQAEKTASRLPWRRTSAATAPAAPPTPRPATAPEPAARPMTPEELDEFFGRPESLAAHRARRVDRG